MRMFWSCNLTAWWEEKKERMRSSDYRWMFVHIIHLVSMHSWPSSRSSTSFPSLVVFNWFMLFIVLWKLYSTVQMSQIIRCLEQSNIHRVDLNKDTTRSSVEEEKEEKINLSVQCHLEILDRLSSIRTLLRFIMKNITLNWIDVWTSTTLYADQVNLWYSYVKIVDLWSSP